MTATVQDNYSINPADWNPKYIENDPLVSWGVRYLFAHRGIGGPHAQLRDFDGRSEVFATNPRLFFVDLEGVRYAVIEANSDQARSSVEFAHRELNGIS